MIFRSRPPTSSPRPTSRSPPTPPPPHPPQPPATPPPRPPPAHAIRQSAEKKGRCSPCDCQNGSQGSNLPATKMKFGSEVGSEIQLRHAVEENRAPGEK